MTALRVYLLALLITPCIVGVKGQTGFRQLPSIIDCPNILRFTCVSTGSGRTELMIGDNMPFRFLHSEYVGGATINVSKLDGNVTAGNLSRSASMECSDMTDYCYTMFVEVHLTGQTLCRMITCKTVLVNGSEIVIGSFTASRSMVPSTPTNLRKLFQSENSVTFGWNPGSSTTCNRNYSVSIMNCGTCNQDSFVSRTNVTCDNREPGQQMQCSVTVQSVTECGVFSAPLTDVFKVLSTENTTMTTVLSTESKTNVGAIIGGCIGAVVFIGIVLLLVIILCILVIRYRRSTKRGEERLLTQNTPTPAKQSQTVSGLDNKPIPMESLDKSEQGSPQTKKAPTDLDQPPSSEAQAVATGAGESSEQSQSETSVNGAKADVSVIIQQSVSQDHQADPKAPTDKPTSSGAQAAATVTGEPQSLKQNQSEIHTSLEQLNIKPEAADIDGDPDPSSVKPKASVSNVVTDESDSQRTVPQEHQSELKTPTDQLNSSGGEITANGPGGQQSSLERRQSEEVATNQRTISEAQAAANGPGRQQAFERCQSETGVESGVRTDEPDNQHEPPDHQDDSETSTDQSTSSESETAATGNRERQPLERSQSERSKSGAFGSSDSDPQPLVKPKLKKMKRRKKAVHKMSKPRHPPPSIDRAGPGDDVKAFGELVAMESQKNSQETRTRTSANIEHKRGHPVTSISVPPSSSGNGHSPRVYMSPPRFPNDAGLAEFQHAFEEFERKHSKEIEDIKTEQGKQQENHKKEIQDLKTEQGKQQKNHKKEIQGLKTSLERKIQDLETKQEQEIIQLKSEITHLKGKLTQQEQYIKKLEEEKEIAEKNIEELKKKERSDEQYIKELEKRDADVQDMTKKLEKQQDEVKTTKQQLKDREEKLEDREKALKDREEKLKNWEDKLKDWEEKLREQDDENSKLEDD